MFGETTICKMSGFQATTSVERCVEENKDLADADDDEDCLCKFFIDFIMGFVGTFCTLFIFVDNPLECREEDPPFDTGSTCQSHVRSVSVEQADFFPELVGSWTNLQGAGVDGLMGR